VPLVQQVPKEKQESRDTKALRVQLVPKVHQQSEILVLQEQLGMQVLKVLQVFMVWVQLEQKVQQEELVQLALPRLTNCLKVQLVPLVLGSLALPVPQVQVVNHLPVSKFIAIVSLILMPWFKILRIPLAPPHPLIS